MKIAILGPVHKTSIAPLLPNHLHSSLPEGYFGAPFLGNLITELIQRDNEVICITTTKCIDGNWNTKKFHFKNFTWIVVPFRPHAVRPKFGKYGRILDAFAAEIRAMKNALQEEKPQIVHAHWSYEFASATLKAGFPYLITPHDQHWKIFRFIPDLYRFVRAVMAEKNLRRAENVTAISPYMQEYLSLKFKNVPIVPNPVTIRINESRVSNLIESRLDTLQHRPQFIMINSGWRGRKNGVLGLELFSSIVKRWPAAHMHLVGSGSEANGYAYEDAVRIGVQNSVSFHGILRQEKIFELLEKIHFVIHPSLEESFGVSLVEANSFGVPAFGIRGAGAVPWIIENETLLIDRNNIPSGLEKIVRLINFPSEYKNIALKCFHSARDRFSLHQVTDKYLAEYSKLVGECA